MIETVIDLHYNYEHKPIVPQKFENLPASPFCSVIEPPCLQPSNAKQVVGGWCSFPLPVVEVLPGEDAD